MKKFDQLAIVVDSLTRQDALTRLGAWTADTVVTKGVDNAGHLIENRARLMFNYDQWPMEYEVLLYEEGWNWHMLNPFQDSPYLSHYGQHVPAGAAGYEAIESAKEQWPVLQESVTQSHTNPTIAESRRYRYVIFDTREHLGAELKLIQRLTIEEAAVVLAEVMMGARG